MFSQVNHNNCSSINILPHFTSTVTVAGNLCNSENTKVLQYRAQGLEEAVGITWGGRKRLSKLIPQKLYTLLLAYLKDIPTTETTSDLH
jgi:hypothetical protein